MLTASASASSLIVAHSLSVCIWCGAGRQPVEGSQSSVCGVLLGPALPKTSLHALR